MKVTVDRITALAKEAEAAGQRWEAVAINALAAAMRGGQEELVDLTLAVLVYCRRAKPRLKARLAALVSRN
jgi:hypothetical protein